MRTYRISQFFSEHNNLMNHQGFSRFRTFLPKDCFGSDIVTSKSYRSIPSGPRKSNLTVRLDSDGTEQNRTET